MADGHTNAHGLHVVSTDTTMHEFTTLCKKINDGADVSFFLTSKAYADVMTFLLDLNGSMFPRRQLGTANHGVLVWDLVEPETLQSSAVKKLASMLNQLSSYIEEVPPDTGPRRFGNASFRKWFALVESRVEMLLIEYLPRLSAVGESQVSEARKEIQAYLLGSFGSAQRLDYGTGHELSFLAFLGCIWKLGGFSTQDEGNDGAEQRAIVIGVIQPYVEDAYFMLLGPKPAN